MDRSDMPDNKPKRAIAYTLPVCKIINLLIALSILLLLYNFSTDTYNYTTEDGYDGVRIAWFMIKFVVLPTVLINIGLLWLAIKQSRKQRYAAAVVSVLFGSLSLVLLLSIVFA